jgi:invasion protein IalB
MLIWKHVSFARWTACAIGVCLMAAATTFPVAAQAQRPAPAQPAAKPEPPPVDPANPQSTTATYGDWVMRCQVMTIDGKPLRSCEVAQTVTLQGQNAPIAQIALGRPKPDLPMFATVLVPPNVAFPSTLRIAIDDKDPKPVELSWSRCLPSGCYANLRLPDAAITLWRSQAKLGRIVFKTGTGQELGVPFSFRGLAAALDALNKQK